MTNGVHFRPGDSDSMYVATTFGLLVSHDAGCTFHWICEQDVGYGGSFDPHYAIAVDGTLFATTFTGLRVSRDGGCSFTTAIADIWIDAIDIGPDGSVWVATAESGKPNDVFQSTDNGATFQARGMTSPTIWWKSVVVARSNAQRVYLAGYEVGGTPRAHLFATDDAGATWRETALANVAYGLTPIVHVLAVSPEDPQIVILRSLAAAKPTGDKLYRSSDGGETFTEILSVPDTVTDVVFRDAQNVIVTTTGGSVFTSSNAAASLAVVANAPKLTCIGIRPTGTQGGGGDLVGCGTNWDPDFMALADSQDGATWNKVFRFVNLAGPLACPAGTAEHDVCDTQLWPNVQQQLAATGPTCGPEASSAAAPAAPPTTSGSCNAGAGLPASLMLLLVAGIVSRRGLRRVEQRRGAPRARRSENRRAATDWS